MTDYKPEDQPQKDNEVGAPFLDETEYYATEVGEKDPHLVKEVIIPTDEDIDYGLQWRTKVKPYLPLITMFLGFVSVFLTDVLGFSSFPLSVSQMIEGLGAIITVVGMVWGWWQNNDVTKRAKKRTEVADQALPKKTD